MLIFSRWDVFEKGILNNVLLTILRTWPFWDGEWMRDPNSKANCDLQRSGIKFGHELNHLVGVTLKIWNWYSWNLSKTYFPISQNGVPTMVIDRVTTTPATRVTFYPWKSAVISPYLQLVGYWAHLLSIIGFLFTAGIVKRKRIQTWHPNMESTTYFSRSSTFQEVQGKAIKRIGNFNQVDYCFRCGNSNHPKLGKRYYLNSRFLDFEGPVSRNATEPRKQKQQTNS